MTATEKNWISEPHTFGDFIIRSRRTTGRVGKARTGTKVHILIVDEVVGIVEGRVPQRGTYGDMFLRRQQSGDTRPVIFSARGLCNGNGQHVGEELTGYEVNCEKCLR